MMKKSRISASEINEFNYCPYSWLYSHKFGKKHISKQSRNFMMQGTKYHVKHQEKVKKQQPVTWTIIILVILAIVSLFFFLIN